MSAFVGLTPVLKLRLENLLLGECYPKGGYVEGVIDTGYQGFVAVPGRVFESLSFPRLNMSRRRVQLADGSSLESEVSQGTALVSVLDIEVDGPIETIPGLREVLIGTQFLSRFRLGLDYCLRRTSLHRC